MKQHGNSSLTVAQRRLIHDLYHSGKAKKSELARRFHVNRKTIDRWVDRDSPYDKPSGPKNPRKVITPEYRQAVIDYRKTHPDHGPKTIAYYLKAEFNFANRGTILRILQQEGMTKPRPKEKKNDAL
jgi:transposase